MGLTFQLVLDEISDFLKGVPCDLNNELLCLNEFTTNIFEKNSTKEFAALDNKALWKLLI